MLALEAEHPSFLPLLYDVDNAQTIEGARLDASLAVLRAHIAALYAARCERLARFSRLAAARE